MDAARETTATEPAVDWEANAALFGGQVEMGRRFFGRFIELTAPMISSLRAAGSSGDQEEVRRLAHKIKGGSAAVAAVGLCSRTADLETVAASGNWDRVETEMARVLEAWRELELYVSD